MNSPPLDENLLYDKVEPVPFALSAHELIARAQLYTSEITDYDVLAASIKLNHRPSFQQALRTGTGFFSDSFYNSGENIGCVLYCVPRLYFNDRKPIPAPSGTELEGIEYIRILLPLVQYAPQNILHTILDSMLNSAVKRGSWNMAKYLHSQGASFDMRGGSRAWHPRRSQSVLHAISGAPEKGKVQFLDWLPSVMDAPEIIDEINTENNTPLVCAASAGDITTLRWLLENGADPLFKTNDQSCILHHAMMAKNACEVVEVIKKHLDPMLFHRLINDHNDNGYYPIHELVGFNKKNFPVELIVPSSGINTPIANSDYPDTYKGYSALGLAFAQGDLPMAVSLLRAGASVDNLTASGHTPWHLIADLSTSINVEDQRSVRGLVRLALKLDVSPETAVNGKSAYAMASSAYFKEVLAQLRAQKLGGLACPVSSPPASTSAKPKM